MTGLVTPQRLRDAGPWLWSGAMALLVTAPLLLSRGFALTHDMVFVPRQPFKDAWLGLDGSVPRAVPIDAIVSLLSVVVPGDILQKLVIFGLLALAGGGAAAAVPGSGLPGKLAASTLYVWNPYVFERLAMGQWALLCGYAALPWVLVAAMRVRSGRALGWPLLCLALAAAGFTSPTGGVLAGLLCCCVLVGRRAAATWRALALSLVVNLPWIVPSLLYRGGIPADPDGVSAFAARSDTPYGVLGSLASLGGMWNTDVVPPGRDSWFLAGLLLLVSLAAIVGVTWSSEVTGGLPVRRLVVVGLIGLVLAAAAALPGGLAVMQWADVHLPGAGLLRDSQKWVALLALVEAIGLAALVTRLGRRLSRSAPRRPGGCSRSRSSCPWRRCRRWRGGWPGGCSRSTTRVTGLRSRVCSTATSRAACVATSLCCPGASTGSTRGTTTGRSSTPPRGTSRAGRHRRHARRRSTRRRRRGSPGRPGRCPPRSRGKRHRGATTARHRHRRGREPHPRHRTGGDRARHLGLRRAVAEAVAARATRVRTGIARHADPGGDPGRGRRGSRRVPDIPGVGHLGGLAPLYWPVGIDRA